ncbi:MAG: class I SAM-dependent methyltransferase [bacterium]
MNDPINREKESHGAHWNAVHEGYFSDPGVAAPLVRKVLEAARASKPGTLVDLGGGTGFLLSRLRAEGVDPGIRLVDLDDSPAQVAAAETAGISCLLKAVDAFSRRDIGPEDGRCLFLMRSVLHYFGKDGLRPVLRHLRAQMRPGEFFVHQTASFARQQDADCLNTLYQLMRTTKWYPGVAFLCDCLREEGWQVLEVCPAAALRLRDDDLAQRYQLAPADIRRIRDQLAGTPGIPEDVAITSAAGFCAFLHYWTYVCTPASRYFVSSSTTAMAGKA